MKSGSKPKKPKKSQYLFKIGFNAGSGRIKSLEDEDPLTRASTKHSESSRRDRNRQAQNRRNRPKNRQKQTNQGSEKRNRSLSSSMIIKKFDLDADQSPSPQRRKRDSTLHLLKSDTSKKVLTNGLRNLGTLWYPGEEKFSFEMTKPMKAFLDLARPDRKESTRRIYLEVETPLEYCEERLRDRLKFYKILVDGSYIKYKKKKQILDVSAMLENEGK